MKESTRAVVLGAGMIGAVHTAAIRAAGGQPAGVVASTPERSVRVAEKWNVPGRYTSLESVLSDASVDVVHVCTPNALHVRQAEAALRAGKHVICEKPLATTAADAQMLSELAEKSGLVLAVPFVYRYHPVVREIRDRRLRGDFGAWQLIHGSYLQDWMLPQDAASWRVDPAAGGPSRAFADTGSHWCDLVEWVAGVRFEEVSARFGITRSTRPAGTGASFSATGGGESAEVRTEDVAAVLLRTTGGVLGSLTVSQVSAGRKNRLWFELDGASGSAVFDQEQPETAWLGRPDGARIVVRDPQHGSAEQRRLSRLPAGHAQGYQDCFNSFVADVYAAIRGDAPEGLPTGVDGARSAHIVESVLRSADSLAWTSVPGLSNA
ncbi:Gfo/Idh/MocA family oxidoreductase [Streptomyces sp. NPDC088124]|uniref:Gfo/Idh/MocA family protein n=1 Tax=Streptomyces sp. NPDC088124 TaxID=3154654 RepID=UPI0034364DDA